MERKGLVSIILFIVSFLIFTNSYVNAEEIDNNCKEDVKQIGLDGARLMQKGKLQQAIQTLSAGLELCKRCLPLQDVSQKNRKETVALCLPIYTGLSSSYISSHDYQNGISICEEAARNIPEMAWSFKDTIASVYASQEEYQKAIDVCIATLDLFPESDTTYHVLGRIYYKMGDLQKSKDNILKSLGINKEKGDTKLIKDNEEILRLLP